MFCDRYGYKIPKGVLGVLAYNSSSVLDFGENVSYRPDKVYPNNQNRAISEECFNGVSPIDFHRENGKEYKILSSKMNAEFAVLSR